MLIRHTFLKFLIISTALCHLSLSAKDLEFSGYARVIGGYLDEDNVDYKGYDDSLSFEPSSLIALQAEYKFSEKWSGTTQLIARADRSKDSGIEWLYLTYQATDNLQIKFGKLRAPFFSMSDYTDVGFAYPWINLPQQVYDNFLFRTFEGADLIYKFTNSNFEASIEAYIGQEDGDVNFSNTPTGFTARNLRGLIGKINKNNFELRLAHYEGNLSLNITEIHQFQRYLSNLNFGRSADSLSTKGVAKVEQIGIVYDNLDYFFRSEWVNIETDLDFIPEIQSYYVTAGFNYAPFTFHITFADSDGDSKTPVQEIPVGFDPNLDQLAQAYNSIFLDAAATDMQSWTLGARWDVLSNLALKVEYSAIEEDNGSNSFFDFDENTTFDGKSNLYLVGLEWVF
ncbi:MULTISPECIES: hypothetical protein [Aliiglaciecola]|uniref:hypothetical protein n=1 Tax=Aliiglaciecola TaxID=1406885 RepID=UPI002091521A|nr:MULTISPECIES: hypothetical protein [Aliiglaciecola]MDO6712649.1 hypothetical protein [Aliiglaciecola sp. 2_MG-2023]MDO6753743.1 hypothetical protein [Aliiglaciecola sp. 1_MG-2023]